MYHKSIKAGNTLVAFKYGMPFDKKWLPLGMELAKKKKSNKWVYDRESQNKSRVAQAKAKLRYLVEANQDCRVFLTLTFSPSKCGADNIVSLDWCYMQLRLYFKRLFRKFPQFKAVGVTEFQKDVDFFGGEKEFGGAVHYHFLCNYPYVVDLQEVDNLWQNGSTTLIRLYDNIDVYFYLVKYFNKDFGDRRQLGRRSILVFRAKRPEIITGLPADYVIDEVLDLFPDVVPYEVEYSTPFNGKVQKKIWRFNCCIQW